MRAKFTAVLRREEGDYIALNPELDIANQGTSPEDTSASLREAVSLLLKCASPDEIARRLSEEAWITQFETEHAPA